jgi:hypothetical protein
MSPQPKNEINSIRKSPSTDFKEFCPKGEYILNKNCFDPSTGSPPNNFMLKLQNRMSAYFIVDNNIEKIESLN